MDSQVPVAVNSPGEHCAIQELPESSYPEMRGIQVQREGTYFCTQTTEEDGILQTTTTTKTVVYSESHQTPEVTVEEFQSVDVSGTEVTQGHSEEKTTVTVTVTELRTTETMPENEGDEGFEEERVIVEEPGSDEEVHDDSFKRTSSISSSSSSSSLSKSVPRVQIDPCEDKKEEFQIEEMPSEETQPATRQFSSDAEEDLAKAERSQEVVDAHEIQFILEDSSIAESDAQKTSVPEDADHCDIPKNDETQDISAEAQKQNFEETEAEQDQVERTLRTKSITLKAPLGIDDITEDFVDAVLKERQKGIPEALPSLHPKKGLQRGDNFMSTMVFLEATYPELSHHLAVKMMPQGEIHKKQLQDMGAFDKEVEFYENISQDLEVAFPQIHLHIPKCYFASVEPEAAVIILEDIREKGYSMKDKIQGLSFSCTKLVMEEIAKLHALGIAFKKRINGSLLERYPHMAHNHFNPNFVVALQSSAKGCLELLRKEGMDEDHLERLQSYLTNTNLAERRTKLVQVKPEKESMATICHGDCWMNNFMFKTEDSTSPYARPSDTMFVDFQLCRYTLPVVDLAYFFYTSMSRQNRLVHMKYLLFTYYEAFFSHLHALGMSVYKSDYPFSEFLKDFEDTAEYGFLVSILLLPSILQEGDKVININNREEWEQRDYGSNCTKGMKAATQRISENVLEMIELGVL